MTKSFSIKNFDKYQHYKHRSPPWIKLYSDLLLDYEFGRLPDQTKWHLAAIWLLASRLKDNLVPYDPEWIAKRISATGKIDLEVLRNAGFIVVKDVEGSDDATTSTEVVVAPPSSQKKRESSFRIAADWQPSIDNIKYAVEQGLSEQQARREAENFRDYWIEKGRIKTQANWNLTWDRWIRTAVDRYGVPQGGSNGNRNRRGGSAVEATFELEAAIKDGTFTLPPKPL